MANFTIHTVPGSPFARAVLATLEEKHSPYRIAAVPPGGGRIEPHISRHPWGRMPVIEHGDFMLYETAAIIRYLDRVLPTPALTPSDIIPTPLLTDLRAIALPDGLNAFQVFDEEVPCVCACVDDVVVCLPDEVAKFVGAQIGPDVFHWV